MPVKSQLCQRQKDNSQGTRADELNYSLAAAEVLAACGGICTDSAMTSTTGDASQTPSVAANLFASTDVTSQNLEALLCMPWQKPSTTSTPLHPAQSSADNAQTQAKISALLLQAAAPILGLHELTSSDLNSKQGSSALVHKALQDSDASVQAAAILLLPVIVANTAEAAKGSARGQPTVGIRLLQKGLDCLSDLVHQGGSTSGAVKLALAHALGGFVSMQAVAEHRAVALCKAAEALQVIRQSGSKSSTGKDSRTSGKSANGPFSSSGQSGLHCWPVLKQNLQELPVTGHSGALVPVKAIRGFADALLSGGHDSPQGLEKVLHNAMSCGGQVKRVYRGSHIKGYITGMR